MLGNRRLRYRDIKRSKININLIPPPQAEINARMQMSSSSQHNTERVSQLERQVGDVSEKLRAEQDTAAKFKKLYQDVQQVRAADAVAARAFVISAIFYYTCTGCVAFS